ncbi:MAG TPA: glycosyltransferase family A protein [Edaphobacter sp.]|nr:glycosyltransferase family A protein [Edaphobacter sp.]
MRTKVTVVIPAYNAELYLGETIASVLAQTVQPYEVIVVDDGSKDGTESVVRSFGDRIRYIKQQNQGISGARNTAIHEATGDWIAFLDADDLMSPRKLELQIAAIEANPQLISVYTGFAYLYTDGTTMEMPAFPARDLWPALRYRQPILPSTCIVRRSALEEVGGFKRVTRRYFPEDWDLWFRLIRRYSAAAFQEVPENLTMYRWWENNASRNFMPMADAKLELLDHLLLDDITGLKKMMWKRRIEARFYFDVAFAMREAKNERYWEYAIESLLRWPLWGTVVPWRRYRIVLHMFYIRLRNFRMDLRYWWPVRRCREGLMDQF